MSRYKGRLEHEADAHAKAAEMLINEYFSGVDRDDPEAMEKLKEDPFYIDTLAGMTEFPEIAAMYVERYEDCLANAAACEAKAAQATARAKRFKESAEVAKNRLERVMVEAGIKSLKEATFDLVVAKSGNPPVEVFDRSFLPEKYLRPAAEREPDKNAIRAALKDPALAEEVELAARIGNAAPRLQIKLK